MCKAKKRIWFLRRLKNLGASKYVLLYIFRTFIRPVLEMAVPLFAGALTKRNSHDIESVQKICIKLITGQNLFNYEQSLKNLSLDTLEARREKFCLNFAQYYIPHLTRILNKKLNSQ